MTHRKRDYAFSRMAILQSIKTNTQTHLQTLTPAHVTDMNSDYRVTCMKQKEANVSYQRNMVS